MTKRFSLLFSAAALLALSACVEPRTEWVKPGADADELRHSRQTCERESSGYTFVDDSRMESSSSRDRGPSSARSDIYRRCMEALGWRRQRGEPPK
jgi:hypothetical protein